jgi:hypothetical protein
MSFDIDPYYLLTQDLRCSQEQYCGLDTDSYIALTEEVTMKIVAKQIDTHIQQMIAKFDLSNDYFNIFQGGCCAKHNQ